MGFDVAPERPASEAEARWPWEEEEESAAALPCYDASVPAEFGEEEEEVEGWEEPEFQSRYGASGADVSLPVAVQWGVALVVVLIGQKLIRRVLFRSDSDAADDDDDDDSDDEEETPPPLSKKPEPTPEELRAQWMKAAQDRKWAKQMEVIGRS